MRELAWNATVIGIGVSVVLAVLAAALRRDWLALPIVLPVTAALTLTLLGVPRPAGTWFAPALVVGLLALATTGGGPLVAFVLRVLVRSPEKLGKHGGIVLDDHEEGTKRGRAGTERGHEVLRGGTTIGYLERFAVSGAVLMGQPAAVAIIVAIKGLGRFTELDSAAARERFIIGTLLSFIWAAVCTSGIVGTW
jgi:hypothetical protein